MFYSTPMQYGNWQTQPPFIRGRQVASIDEVRAAQVDFSGNAAYYPCPAQNVIYVKYLDLNTGSAVILEYKPVSSNFNNSNHAEQQSSVQSNGYVQLEQRVARLERELGVNTNAESTVTSNAGQQ